MSTQRTSLRTPKVKPGTISATHVAIFSDSSGLLIEDGGVPAGTGTVTNTGALTDHALIVGNGGVDVSALGDLGTVETVVYGNPSADPAFAVPSVPIKTNVNSTLPTDRGWVVPEALEIAAGVILEIGAGARLEITGDQVPLLGTPHYVLPTIDQSSVNNTLANDAELFFAVGASQIYLIEVNLLFTTGTSTTPDAQYAFTFPTGGTLSGQELVLPPGATASNAANIVGIIQTASGTVLALGVISTATIPATPAVFAGILRLGANAGTLNLQWAQNSTTAGTPTVRNKDSWLRYTRIA